MLPWLPWLANESVFIGATLSNFVQSQVYIVLSYVIVDKCI